ncbi:hypothetical protein J6590_078904 [Homalodisca vitripennis]|nr:hypothetical protein J6590_078904 [Homalodisca vitripennis]
MITFNEVLSLNEDYESKPEKNRRRNKASGRPTFAAPRLTWPLLLVLHNTFHHRLPGPMGGKHSQWKETVRHTCTAQ